MAHFKLGPPDWHMVTMHGDPPHVQGLHKGGPRISSTLSPRVSPSQTGLGGLLSHLAKMGAPNDITFSWPFVMLGEAIFEREDDPSGVKGTMEEVSPTLDNRLTSLAVLSSTSFGRRDVGSILISASLGCYH